MCIDIQNQLITGWTKINKCFSFNNSNMDIKLATGKIRSCKCQVHIGQEWGVLGI